MAATRACAPTSRTRAGKSNRRLSERASTSVPRITTNVGEAAGRRRTRPSTSSQATAAMRGSCAEITTRGNITSVPPRVITSRSAVQPLSADASFVTEPSSVASVPNR